MGQSWNLLNPLATNGAHTSNWSLLFLPCCLGCGILDARSGAAAELLEVVKG